MFGVSVCALQDNSSSITTILPRAQSMVISRLTIGITRGRKSKLLTGIVSVVDYNLPWALIVVDEFFSSSGGWCYCMNMVVCENGLEVWLVFIGMGRNVFGACVGRG